jgi:hypothetical protein
MFSASVFMTTGAVRATSSCHSSCFAIFA